MGASAIALGGVVLPRLDLSRLRHRWGVLREVICVPAELLSPLQQVTWPEDAWVLQQAAPAESLCAGEALQEDVMVVLAQLHRDLASSCQPQAVRSGRTLPLDVSFLRDRWSGDARCRAAGPAAAGDLALAFGGAYIRRAAPKPAGARLAAPWPNEAATSAVPGMAR